MTALTADVQALAFAAPVVRADREFMAAAAQVNGWVLRFAPPPLLDDPMVVAAAVGQNGNALALV